MRARVDRFIRFESPLWVYCLLIGSILALLVFGVSAMAERQAVEQAAAILQRNMDRCERFGTAFDVETRYVEGFGCYQRTGDGWTEVE